MFLRGARSQLSALSKRTDLTSTHHNFPPGHEPPYSLTVKDAADHFGFAENTLRQWISNGTLARGIHFLKIGRKVVIKREAFIEWMEERDGSRAAR